MESRVSTSLNRSTSETWSVCERASVRKMKSKAAAVNRVRQYDLIIGTSSCAMHAAMASQRFQPRMNTDFHGWMRKPEGRARSPLRAEERTATECRPSIPGFQILNPDFLYSWFPD